MNWFQGFIEKRLYPKEYYFGYHRGLSARDAAKLTHGSFWKLRVTNREIAAIVVLTVCWFFLMFDDAATARLVGLLVSRSSTVGLVVALMQLGFWVALPCVGVLLVRARQRRSLEVAENEIGLRPIRCMRCDYDIRQIDSASCPECGHPIPGGDRPSIG